MKHISLISLMLPLLFGCIQTPDYQLSASTRHLKEIQILDPQAPELNEGVINDLSGSYGERIIKSYQQSSYNAKDARDVEQVK